MTTATVRRHGCATVYLWVALVVNVGLGFRFLFWGDLLGTSGGDSPLPLRLLGTLGCLANILCLVALLLWRRWGFYGACATAAGVFALNLKLGVSMGPGVIGLVGGIGLLWLVLHIGGQTKTWPQLK